MKNILLRAKDNIGKLQISFALTILGLVLAPNVVKGQDFYSADNEIANNITSKVKADNDKHTSAVDSTIRIWSDDGFYKVTYVKKWNFNDDAVSKLTGEQGGEVSLPAVEIYDEAFNKLDMKHAALIYAYSIKRVTEFPPLLAGYFSKYMVLAVKFDKDVAGTETDVVEYFAIDSGGATKGHSYQSLVQLKVNIEERDSRRNHEYKTYKLSRKEKKLMEQELQKQL
jgi:hypothetical protein